LTGSGRINGKVVNDGKIAFLTPHDHLAILGALIEKSHAELDFQIGRLRPDPVLDRIDVTGAGLFNDPSLGHAHFDGLLELTLAGTGFHDGGEVTYVLLTSQFPISGSFTDVASGSRLTTTDGGGSFRVEYTGHDLVLTDFQANAVAEPSSVVLLMIGLATTARLVAKRRRGQKAG
jgi:hypothetical protein